MQSGQEIFYVLVFRPEVAHGPEFPCSDGLDALFLSHLNSFSPALSWPGVSSEPPPSDFSSPTEFFAAIRSHLLHAIQRLLNRRLRRVDKRSGVLHRRHRENTMTKVENVTPAPSRRDQFARL